MAVKTKKAVVSRKVYDEQLQNAKRWDQVIIHSGIRFEDLSNEWVMFFDAQAEISTAQTELVRLIDAAILADNKRNGISL